jgi:thiopeptide-type bacteriocin biosynthesis protein
MKMVQRTFIPGSKWVYIKIYSGIKTADQLLASDIYDLVQTIKNQQWIDKWFFIRYADPHTHLRIRFLLKKEQYVNEILHLFYQKLNRLIRGRLIWKIQIDTYNREIERYGNSLIDTTESLFCIDSDCALDTVKMITKIGNENYRWMIALKMIDDMLSDFSLPLHEKQKLMENISNAYKKEFGFTKYNVKQFNTKFRERKTIVESLLDNTIQDEKFVILYYPLRKKSKQFIPIIKQIRLKLKRSYIQIQLHDLLKSYVHMMLNRLFRSKSRVHELVLYDFMRRYYTSKIAKLKYTKKM